VYRPGDEIHIGLVVKQRNWRGNLKGLPIETEVVDARDLKVQTKKVTLLESGFVELNYQTANESPTGVYTINVYLVKNNKRGTLLGSTTASVKEFLPDRMKIETRLSKGAPRGWVSPNEMKASIALANLYGTPATDRRVTGYVNALISALPYVIGYKAGGDLSYIDMNKPRAVDLIAVDPQLNRIAVENVTLNVIAQEYVSVLKKQENGNYVYESVLRERPTKSEKIAVATGGLHYALPTTAPGDYVLELRDDQNRTLSKLHFSVVGQGATARSLEKNAE